MGDYIDREAAQKIICGLCGVCQNPTLHDLMHCDDICPQFAQIPAADVRPVKRGRWMAGIYGSVFIVCSVCGYEWYAASTMSQKFCPNCGADMREEATDGRN